MIYLLIHKIKKKERFPYGHIALHFYNLRVTALPNLSLIDSTR